MKKDMTQYSNSETKIKLPSPFKPNQDIAIEIIRKKNLAGESTYFMPTKYLSFEASKLGFLFNQYFNCLSDNSNVYKTFFASSHIEAINGTIKIIRHNAYIKKKNGQVVIYDNKEIIRYFFNPLNVERDRHSLVPGLLFINNFDELKLIVNNQYNDLIGIIYIHNNDISIIDVDDIFQQCQSKNIIVAFDDSYLTNWYRSHLSTRVFKNLPDIFIFGENLVDNQLPYGSFSIRDDKYCPWENIVNCLNHSSSNSGNTLTLSMVLHLFDKYNLSKELDNDIINNKQTKRISYYTEYINPVISSVFESISLTPEILEARESTIFINRKNTREKILDCVGGSGCSIRGHNPKDIISEVLDIHNTKVNYWDKLSSTICKLTNMYAAFPSVSGSSAVDIAIILSLLAAYPKTKIITFSNNYAGKSLIALNFTRFSEYQKPFTPLYFDILELDPFKEETINILKNELCSKKVALVWFELMQGNELKTIPESVISLINYYKEEGEYFIGIDEVLTGVFRTGSFLYSEGKVCYPDVVTIGKGLTDMTFPQGATVVSKNLYGLAVKRNLNLVEELEKYYVNQLAAHIALNAIEKAIKDNIPQKVKEKGELFKSKLKEIAEQSNIISEVRGEGLLLYVVLNKKALLVNLLGVEISEFLISSLLLNHGNVLILNFRLSPSLYITNQEITEVCNVIKKIFGKKNMAFINYFCILSAIKTYLNYVTYKIKKSLKRLVYKN